MSVEICIMKLKEIFRLEKKYTLIYLGFFLSVIIYLFIYIAGILDRLEIYPGLVPPEYLTDFVWLIPGPLITDILILYILPIIFIILAIKIMPRLCYALIKIHKFSYIGRGESNYGIIQLTHDKSVMVLMRRALVLGFLSFSISAYIVNLGLGWLFRSNMMLEDPARTLNIAEAMFLATFFFTSIALFVSVPVWLLEDSGIAFYRTFEKNNKIPNLRGTHRLYDQILEFFTGISTILLLINIIIRCFNVLNPGDVAILTPLILIVLPLFVTGLFAISLILYEKLLPETTEKVHEILKKKEIPILSIPNFDDLIRK